jgi:glycosyltransferase involved in cell wall biosynthesis
VRKEQRPKVSVIMSVYNGIPFLKKSVESILNQTYKNFEFIIVDDFSTDGSWKYLASLHDKRVKLIRNKKNLRLTKSLNKALTKACGDFIARMDADDISMPQRLEKQIRFLMKNRSIDLCGTFAALIDKNGKKVGKLHYPQMPDEIKRKLVLYNPIVHPSLMAREAVFKKLKGYNEEFDGAEDYELLMRGSKFFNYANISEELLMLRLSLSRRSVGAMYKMDKLDLKIKFKFLKENGPSLINIYAICKKLFFTYLIPSSLKIKISQILKKA